MLYTYRYGIFLGKNTIFYHSKKTGFLGKNT